MLEFENTIRIDCPIEEVFAFLSDFENIPKWNYYVLEVRQLSDGPIGIGTAYHQVRKTDEQDFRITEFEPNRMVAVKTLPQSSPSFERRTTIRSPEYWRSQLEWLREDRDGFLLSRTKDGTLAGYVRSRAGETDVEILELGLRAGDAETGRALLSAAARNCGRLQASLPPSLLTLFRPGEGEITSEFGLMARGMNLGAIVAALEPAWLRRVRESGGRGGSFHLATGAGHAKVAVGAEGVLFTQGADECALEEREFAHRLFRGFDSVAGERLGARPDSTLLRVLFPAQDFVVWRADAF